MMQLVWFPSPSDDVVSYKITARGSNGDEIFSYLVTGDELNDLFVPGTEDEPTGYFKIDLDTKHDFSQIDDEITFEVVAIDEADNHSTSTSTKANIDYIAPEPPAKVYLVFLELN